MTLKMPKHDRQFMMDMYTLATVGLNIVAGTFIGLGMGWLIDHKLFWGVFHVRTDPWFTMIFLLFGIIAGFRNMYRIAVSKGHAGDDSHYDNSPYDNSNDDDRDDDRDEDRD